MAAPIADENDGLSPDHELSMQFGRLKLSEAESFLRRKMVRLDTRNALVSRKTSQSDFQIQKHQNF